MAKPTRDESNECPHGVAYDDQCQACEEEEEGRMLDAMDEPDIDDTVHECPNCERAQQFSGLCGSCMEEMRHTPNDPFWQRIHAS